MNARRLIALILAATLVGCMAAPLAPPSHPTPPTSPPPYPPAPPEQPTERPPTRVVEGMTRAQVVDALGPPTIDLPENPGEDDLVRYVVPGGAWNLTYRDDILVVVAWSPTGVVR